MVEIEINGKKLEVEPGSMIIEAADAAGIAIPRFCYHKKLSIAANCRMCLVEVDKIRKPVPACATPITEGMKVFTQSRMALESQQAVMEFLLINHPLDCPICDQGGECELQDLAVGYGDDISQYTEGKRVVNDKDIGPLISTDLTRCIQCTRCVRFGDEIAGVRELGMIGRGEHEMISTYMNKTVDSELSGNVIDLCPVGALTNKPYRYTARPWELKQRPSISPHDCVGSAIFTHARRQEVMRVVPQENESINETWIADRDRYSYQGLSSHDRLQKPMVKDNHGNWQSVDWGTALNRVVNGLSHVLQHHQSQQIGALISASATIEESYLLQKLVRSLGSDNIDHRLRQQDFSDDADLPLSPASAASMADISSADRVLLIGSHTRKEQPMVAHRIRMAHINGATVSVVNPIDYDFAFDITAKAIVKPSKLPQTIAGIAKALYELNKQSPIELVAAITPSQEEKAIAEHIFSGEKKIICVGELALNHSEAAVIRALVDEISRLSKATVVSLYNGGNAIGAWLAGAVPHRKPGGVVVEKPGLNAHAMFQNVLKAYLLVGIEPEFDATFGETTKATLSQAEFVVSLTCYDSPAIRDYADVMLPITPFTETSGTLVNFVGTWQSFMGVVAPLGEARPAWKVLRVLGNLLGLPHFEYDSSEQVAAHVKELTNESKLVARQRQLAALSFAKEEAATPGAASVMERIVEVPIYSVDPIVRRAEALQDTKDAQVKHIGIHPETAQELGFKEGQRVKVSAVANLSYSVILPLKFNNRLLQKTVRIAAGIAETAALGAVHTQVILELV
jgi:NADH-quinone oxidoreductase subunit G